MNDAPRMKLESGRELECINALEAVFLSGDVEQYFAHGITLSPGATVLDVGANIGVFSVRVLERLGGDATVYAFEPLPPIHAVLARNVERAFPGRVRALNYGLGSRDEELEFTFFPLLTVLSSTRRTAGPGSDLETEKKRLADTVLAMIREGRLFPNLRFLPEEFVNAMVESHIASALKHEVHPARVRRFSSALASEKVDGAIDLLKIDVEGAELEVLGGIDDADWLRVRQIVLEVEHFRSRAPLVRELLAGRGFSVHAEQDSAQIAGDFGLVYGRSRAGR